MHFRTPNRRGISLASSLLLAVVLLVLLFTISGASITNYSIATRAENTRIAVTLAESAANLAVSQCQTKLDWGVAGVPAENLQVTSSTAPGGLGRVIFDQATANSEHLPRSVNNLNSRDSVVGHQGRVIPGESLHILATGSYQGISKTIETIVNIPPYKFAVASTGPIQSNGGLLLASIDDPAAVAGGADNIDPKRLKPAHIVSNSGDTPALKLEANSPGDTRIMGDAEAVGTIEIGKFAEVNGAVKPNQPNQPIPQITVSDFDPQGQSNTVSLGSPMEGNGLKVVGPSRRAGNLEVYQGLNLDGGYLYVDGDLEVYGGIKGRGAIFSTGQVKIHDVSNFVADDRQAIIANGDVGIEGSSKNSSVYQGVIYTGGKFNAKHMTLLGALIANGKNSQIELQNVNMLYHPKSVDFQWDRTWQPTNPIYAFSASLVPSFGVEMKNFTTGIRDPADAVTPLCFFKASQSPLMVLDPKLGPETFWNEKSQAFVFDPKLIKVQIKLPTTIQTAQPGNNGQPTGDILYRTYDAPIGDPLANIRSDPDYNTSTFGIGAMGPSGLLTQLNGEFTAQMHLIETELAAAVADYNNRYQNSLPKWVSKGEFTFNPNRFIATSDKMRRLLWREYAEPNQSQP